MKNIFAKTMADIKKPNRNLFDLSFQNNLTMKFGKLYPVFCQEVVPGDSFKIDSVFGLKFAPIVFPVQTRMRADLHFFYVRNRNLWEDWPDFIGKTKDLSAPTKVAPYISQGADFFKTGSLSDYLGVPTTVLQGDSSVYSITFDCYQALGLPYSSDIFNFQKNFYSSAVAMSLLSPFSWGDNQSISQHWQYSFNGLSFTNVDELSKQGALSYYCLASKPLNSVISNSELKFSVTNKSDVFKGNYFLALFESSTPEFIGSKLRVSQGAGNVPCIMGFDSSVQADCGFSIFDDAGSSISLNLDQTVKFVKTSSSAIGYFNFYREIKKIVAEGKYYYLVLLPNSYSDGSHYCENIVNPWLDYGAVCTYDNKGTVLLDDSNIVSYPWDSANHTVNISALPFRAYESIYNAFYRNQQNDPFLIDGVAEYNRYITNNKGGADTTPYELKERNWEPDFLTSALQSPTQGNILPLVGVTSTGTFTFTSDDGQQTYEAHAITGNDGDTIKGFAPNPDMPRGTLNALNELTSVGISISDFRNVNAFQRWLETNIRKGYKYKDQIMSHFGVKTEYSELDMPEFLGGVTEPVMVNQISQSYEQYDSQGNLTGKPLGSYAGQANCMGSSKHSVSHYCDEHGFIIGILSIVPVPNYSQLLHKKFLKNSPLDYFFPEFAHIGYQPITYKEVCPLQIPANQINNVFGYQRAWYDMIANVDEVHGQFRTTMRDYLINRTFGSSPELGHDFLSCNSEALNDVFAETNDDDKIFGQVYFQCFAKRPISKFGVPRLE